MSPRAAWRLEQLGFGPVYDYVGGKVDWLAAGQPTEHSGDLERRAADVARGDVATCAVSTPLSELPLDQSVIVVNDENVVLGRVRASTDRAGEGIAADVMEPGPTTVRANEPLDDLLQRMGAKSVREMIVTAPDGRLLGIVDAL